MPPVAERKPIDFFTIEEEKRFIEVAKDYSYYEQFRLILETGLRTGELIGKITVDTYVHQTGKSQADEAERFSEYLDGLFL